MQILNYRIPVVCLLPVILFVGIASSWFYMSKIDEAYRITTQGVLQVTERERTLERELEHRRMIDSMAVEFNLSPLIVGAIYHEVSILDRSNWTTWRFVRTPEYFTYLLCSIIKTESRGREEAVGDGGKAFGLTQMWMTTAKMHDKSVTKSDLLNPIRHIPLAVKHFAYLLEESGGNIGVATIKWNRGHARVERLLNEGLNPENGYVARVMTAAVRSNGDLHFSGGS